MAEGRSEGKLERRCCPRTKGKDDPVSGMVGTPWRSESCDYESPRPRPKASIRARAVARALARLQGVWAHGRSDPFSDIRELPFSGSTV